MSDFVRFANAVAVQFEKMSQQELFRVGLPVDEVWSQYLAAFPEGSNPIFRVRTHHDGSYDRSFLKQLGNVVAIDANGDITSIWDTPNLEYPYNEVAAHMRGVLAHLHVTALFRTRYTEIGRVSSTERLENGSVHVWHHFHATVAKRHRTDDVQAALGGAEATAHVFARGVNEITPEAINTVLELIASKALYRGEEMKPAVLNFQKLQLSITSSTATTYHRNRLLWASSTAAGARIRNSVIGTLLTDLSTGVDLEHAVRSYEQKVAPANYKRPTALITQGMIKQAMETIRAEGLEPALERRHAKISDVSVNNVLWVNNRVQVQMKDSLEALLQEEVSVQVTNLPKALDIPIQEFMTSVLPKALSMELFFEGRHRSNLMSLTAPVHADAPPLFKWDNGFAWSYNGDLADSEMRKAVVARGGSVTGVFRFTHQWNYDKRNASLMDLHVFLPGNTTTPTAGEGVSSGKGYGNNERVGWNARAHTRTQGVQDVDYVAEAPAGHVPVENITFPRLDLMPDGAYRCYVHNWRFRSPTQGGFRAEIEFGGDIYTYEVDRPLKGGEWVHVATATLKAGQFTIEHALPPGHSAQESWGIHTQHFVTVNTVLNSPNHWDGKQTGNQHTFFILDNCRNDEPVRGIYNEFLKPEYEKHRKVFEVLGNKTKCPIADEQLSGLGFSSTVANSVLMRVTDSKSTRLYNITF